MSALWFIVLGIAAVVQILGQPEVLAALNPLRAIEFVQAQGLQFFIVLGAVVLAFTGAEALYADLGHFGKRPVKIAWTSLVLLPALALNYMGQGALLMRDPAALENPFFRLFPIALLVPAVVLTTVATIIASQAVITGAYSMTKQAIQLGLLPRMKMNLFETTYFLSRETGDPNAEARNGALARRLVRLYGEERWKRR